MPGHDRYVVQTLIQILFVLRVTSASAIYGDSKDTCIRRDED